MICCRVPCRLAVIATQSCQIATQAGTMVSQAGTILALAVLLVRSYQESDLAKARACEEEAK
jgi:hypothetical protein